MRQALEIARRGRRPSRRRSSRRSAASTPQTRERVQKIIDEINAKYGVKIEIQCRPGNPESLQFYLNGTGVPKPEWVKPKNTEWMDLPLGAPRERGRQGDGVQADQADRGDAPPATRQAQQQTILARYDTQLKIFNDATKPGGKFAKLLADSKNPEGATVTIGHGTGTRDVTGLKYSLRAVGEPGQEAFLVIDDAAGGKFVLSDADYQAVVDADSIKHLPAGKRGQAELELMYRLNRETVSFGGHGWTHSGFDMASKYSEAVPPVHHGILEPGLGPSDARVVRRPRRSPRLAAQDLSGSSRSSSDVRRPTTSWSRTSCNLPTRELRHQVQRHRHAGRLRGGDPMSARRRTRIACLRSAAAVVSAALLLASWPRARARSPPVTFTVDSTADAPDAVPGDGICATAAAACTLRAAIDEAVASGAPSEIDLPAGTLRRRRRRSRSQPAPSRSAARIGDDDRRRGRRRAGSSTSHGGTALGLERLTITNGSATQEGRRDPRRRRRRSPRHGDGRRRRRPTATAAACSPPARRRRSPDSLFDQDTALVGGAIAVMGGDLTITGSTFTGCLATDVGGAVAAFAPQALTITSSTFTGNTAEHSGGAVFLSGADGSTAYTITGSTFTDNLAFGGSGGAIGADGLVAPGVDGALVVTGCSFTGNQADRAGRCDRRRGRDHRRPATPSPTTARPRIRTSRSRSPPISVAPPASARGARSIPSAATRRSPRAGAPDFAPIIGVRLANAFGDVLVDLTTAAAALRARGHQRRRPARRRDASRGVRHQAAEGAAEAVPPTGLALTSQLGDARRRHREEPTSSCCRPPRTRHAGPEPRVNQVDRFTCSQGEARQGSAEAREGSAAHGGRSSSPAVPTRVVVKKLVRLCAPVGENGGATQARRPPRSVSR